MDSSIQVIVLQNEDQSFQYTRQQIQTRNLTSQAGASANKTKNSNTKHTEPHYQQQTLFIRTDLNTFIFRRKYIKLCNCNKTNTVRTFCTINCNCGCLVLRQLASALNVGQGFSFPASSPICLYNCATIRNSHTVCERLILSKCVDEHLPSSSGTVWA